MPEAWCSVRRVGSEQIWIAANGRKELFCPLAYAFGAAAIALLLVRQHTLPGDFVPVDGAARVASAVSDLRHLYGLGSLENQHIGGDELHAASQRRCIP